MTDSSEWMTIPEVAAAFGCTPNAVRTWVKRGHLASARGKPADGADPARLWVRRSDVRAFAERHYTGKPRPGWLDEDP